MTFDTLAEAIAWTQYRWDRQRTVPIRLHEARTTDGALGGMRYTGAFLAALEGKVDGTETVTERTSCSHPGKEPGTICRMCLITLADGKQMETGVYERSIDRYRYPMTLALSRLANAIRPRRGLPHPRVCVDTLAACGWEPRVAAQVMGMPWDLAEALFLQALRQLHSRYSERPAPKRSWVDKSESQQRAEGLPAA